MTKKRKQPHSNSEEIFYNKRARLSQTDGGGDDSPSAAQARIDPTYGQRGAFPGLDDPTGEEVLFYGPANDGLEYLRMVRSEAKTVPNLLVAPIPSTEQPKADGLYDDYPQGYYADGAYTATPFVPANASLPKLGEDEDMDPQDAYYSALCSRFAELSSILQSPNPPPDGIPTPPPNYKLSQWRYKFLNSAPKTAVLAQIPQEMVIRGLEVLEDVLTAGNLRTASGKNIGAWAWGLLTRCREVGQMGSEEVGVLRKLGKKAVWLLRRIAAGEVVEEEVDVRVDTEEREEEKNDGDGDEGDDPDGDVDVDDAAMEDELESSQVQIGPTISMDGVARHSSLPPEDKDSENGLAEARQRMLASLDTVAETQKHPEGAELPDKSPLDNSGSVENSNAQIQTRKEVTYSGDPIDGEAVHATLDMIVTIVGEFYGQRDLLDGRLLWDELS